MLSNIHRIYFRTSVYIPGKGLLEHSSGPLTMPYCIMRYVVLYSSIYIRGPPESPRQAFFPLPPAQIIILVSLSSHWASGKTGTETFERRDEKWPVSVTPQPATVTIFPPSLDLISLLYTGRQIGATFPKRNIL